MAGAAARNADAAIHVPGWEALVEADRALQASPHVADAVMRAWAERTSALPARRRRFAAGTWAAAAAAAAMGVLGAVPLLRDAPQAPVEDAPVATVSTPQPPAAPVVETIPNVPPPLRGRERLSAAYRAVTGAPDSPIVTLAADPPVAGESLQIVRMRVPRHALHAFGLSLGDPEIAEIVEVDVVVGEDGLPRDIRRVRPVVEREQ